MKLAIVEDDINMRKSLEIALGDYKEFEVVSFKNPVDALKKLDDSIDLIITDINMPKMDGVTFLKELNGRYEAIVITGNATLNRAVESLRLGAKDFLTKPFEINDLVSAIKRSNIVQHESLKIKPIKNKDTKSDKYDFISEALEPIHKMALKSAKTDVSIMLLGESGVGKEVFANFIHENSPRVKQPFIALNMAAIPENLLESELFGFDKGSFTDATETKIGKFELANGGTIFLDEMGEMPYSLQAKLLRVLQEKEITRIGSNKSIKLDIRILCATNVNLEEKIKNREFREDLYYRLATIPITIPPLRERSDEILVLANKFLVQTCEKYNYESKEFTQEAKDELLVYQWPGNIRELLSVVERAVIMNEDGYISSEDLFLNSRNNTTEKKNIQYLEKELIAEVLLDCKNDIDLSAEMLGFSKIVLNKKIAKYGL